MAMADYYLCDCCKERKTFYDAELDYDFHTGKLKMVGDMKVICTECAKTKKVVIVDKEDA